MVSRLAPPQAKLAEAFAPEASWRQVEAFSPPNTRPSPRGFLAGDPSDAEDGR